ncbi:MAG TPA: glycosyltransferase, partial [Myxococcaceae bacterium]|nr:glycosyltransferase [Myxococcaceae bacterium]
MTEVTQAGATSKPIRLVEFTNSFYLGGAEGQAVELLRGLLPRYRIAVAVLNEAGPLLETVQHLGYVPRAFPARGSLVHPNTAFQIARCASWLRREQVELVHAHDFFSTLLAVPAAKLAGCKVVVGRLDLAHWQNRMQRAGLALMTR